jgi:uncharacterized membrane protein
MNFIKSTLFSGLLILFPLLLLFLALNEVAGLLMALADPIADLFPAGYFDGAYVPGILAMLIIAFMAFVCGLLARAGFVQRMGRAFERKVLEKVPMYSMLQSISNAFLDAKSSGFTPALLGKSGGSQEPCYIVEEHGNGLATVMVPWTPASFAGSIKVAPVDEIQRVDCSLDEYSRSISLLGVGVADCMRNK